mmetsp:Transcript_31664/g.98563  ORF Transcript_31664/g.98563 Transcript_31664/m.98563 type:complete len:247 (-) Transcript_31664:264-1004(-)
MPRQRVARVPGLRRLAGVPHSHVRGEAAHKAGLEALQDGGVVDHGPPPHVHDEHAALAPRQELRRYQAAGLRRERASQGDDVGVRSEALEQVGREPPLVGRLERLLAGPAPRPLGPWRPPHCRDVRAEGRQGAAEGAADGPEPDHRDSLPSNLPRNWEPAECGGLKTPGKVGQVPQERNGEEEGQLCGTSALPVSDDGMLLTAMPHRVASSMSTPSSPTPNCKMHLNSGAARIKPGSILSMKGNAK